MDNVAYFVDIHMQFSSQQTFENRAQYLQSVYKLQNNESAKVSYEETREKMKQDIKNIPIFCTKLKKEQNKTKVYTDSILEREREKRQIQNNIRNEQECLNFTACRKKNLSE